MLLVDLYCTTVGLFGEPDVDLIARKSSAHPEKFQQKLENWKCHGHTYHKGDTMSTLERFILGFATDGTLASHDEFVALDDARLKD